MGVREQAEEQKVDQEVRMQEMAVDHQFAKQVKEVKKQAMRQRAQLEQQALALSVEYQDKKAEEDMLFHHYAIQQQSRNLQASMRGSQQPSLAPLASIPLLQNPLGSGAVSGTVTPTPSYTPAPIAYVAPPTVAYTPTSSYVPRVGSIVAGPASAVTHMPVAYPMATSAVMPVEA